MLIELLKAILLGVVEGVTEWLPISSTGHMILVDEFIRLNMSEAFMEMFFVVIQMGAILAVVILYWRKLIPLTIQYSQLRIEWDTVVMWCKIVVATIPAAVVGLKWEDEMHTLFFNYQTVAVMLILFGIIFIVVENNNKRRYARFDSIADITFHLAFIIGIFQMIAAVFPGTSRSGATIVGALVFGVSRVTAAEFTFFLAIPAMAGASLVKLWKFGLDFSSWELCILLVGMAVAFITSILAIKFLISYIKRNDFKAFGWYRIILGCGVLLFFFFRG